MLQRINKELAIKLKEKGFNYPCNMLYHNNELSGTKMGMHGRPNDYEGFYAAYYLDEVCKILREEYNIDIFTRPSYAGYYANIEYDLDEQSGSVSSIACNLYSTYEEAQIAGINKAIEVWKIN